MSFLDLFDKTSNKIASSSQVAEVPNDLKLTQLFDKIDSFSQFSRKPTAFQSKSQLKKYEEKLQSINLKYSFESDEENQNFHIEPNQILNENESLFPKSFNDFKRKFKISKHLASNEPLKSYSFSKNNSKSKDFEKSTVSKRSLINSIYGNDKKEYDSQNLKTVSSLPPHITTLNDLIPIEEVPKKFRALFNFSHFNYIQSYSLKDALYTDDNLVISAPTGAGKTVVFELTIIRLLMLKDAMKIKNFKVVYTAPIKALVNERFEDWKAKFTPLGLQCFELTGDTLLDDFSELLTKQIILTTPEKWDFMTRRWKDNKSLVKSICLFFIDEVHTISDDTRGATLEAVVNRMKTICTHSDKSRNSNFQNLRIVAVSATIPNLEDLAEWLGKNGKPAVCHKMDDSKRPVPLKKVVLGFNRAPSSSAFKFDLMLNYKLLNIIETFSEMKPTIVFCSTRKGTFQAATTLAKQANFLFRYDHMQQLKQKSCQFRDTKLSELVANGIAYHHAGLDFHDRQLIEELFISGNLGVLFSTSTLAMGVNLPAHLVIIKSTQHYVMGSFQEYTESQVQQMIGRAGRPQFDSSSVAVIMTQNSTKYKYENLVNGTQLIESTLHQHLIEHLNAEIVLETITDVSLALDWIKESFLFIRINKNSKHYGIPNDSSIENKLQELSLANLNKLATFKLVNINEENFTLTCTETGRLMARYGVAFETIKIFFKLSGNEALEELLNLFCSCEEFKDVTLRVSEKRTLNELNKHKDKITIRFPMKERIKSNKMKVNVLIQAQLGCLPIQDFALQQDANKIFRNASRIIRCLFDFVFSKQNYKLILNTSILAKCIKAKLWENSKYVSRQLTGIGLVMATSFVTSNVTSFDAILNRNPRSLELIVNRQPPFGNTLHDAVKYLPKYQVSIRQPTVVKNSKVAEIHLEVVLSNGDDLRLKSTCGAKHICVLLVGDWKNQVLFKTQLRDSILLQEDNFTWRGKFSMKWVAEEKKDDNSKSGEYGVITLHLMSQDWVGVDVCESFKPQFDIMETRSRSIIEAFKGSTSQTFKKSSGKNGYERCLSEIQQKKAMFKISSFKCNNQALNNRSTLVTPRNLQSFQYVKNTSHFQIGVPFKAQSRQENNSRNTFNNLKTPSCNTNNNVNTQRSPSKDFKFKSIMPPVRFNPYEVLNKVPNHPPSVTRVNNLPELDAWPCSNDVLESKSLQQLNTSQHNDNRNHNGFRKITEIEVIKNKRQKTGIYWDSKWDADYDDMQEYRGIPDSQVDACINEAFEENCVDESYEGLDDEFDNSFNENSLHQTGFNGGSCDNMSLKNDGRYLNGHKDDETDDVDKEDYETIGNGFLVVPKGAGYKDYDAFDDVSFFENQTILSDEEEGKRFQLVDDVVSDEDAMEKVVSDGHNDSVFNIYAKNPSNTNINKNIKKSNAKKEKLCKKKAKQKMKACEPSDDENDIISSNYDELVKKYTSQKNNTSIHQSYPKNTCHPKPDLVLSNSIINPFGGFSPQLSTQPINKIFNNKKNSNFSTSRVIKSGIDNNNDDITNGRGTSLTEARIEALLQAPFPMLGKSVETKVDPRRSFNDLMDRVFN